jgi:hypothetical protein
MIGKLNWPQAFVIGSVVLVMGGLAYFDKGIDTVGLLAVLGALGFVISKQAENSAATQSVKEQTNGNMTKLLDLVEKQGGLLAKMSPPLDHWTFSCVFRCELFQTHRQNVIRRRPDRASRPASALTSSALI